ncbi:MAG TPA: phosphodiester glycosidase family protein [Clostridiales bacterium]|nr:phosphodiester glycosidase family protein [Clostridiales bacterium]HPV01671.1 phosphodiester glycosidase family protein [Clostridiales bacterium]
MKNKRGMNKSIPVIIAILSLILVIEGFFILFRPDDGNGPDMEEPSGELPGEPAEEPPAVDLKEYVKYMHRSETINGLRQEINILEVDMRAPGVRIKPALSYDLVYGYELFSEIASRHDAYAAVNGGFFRDFGLPSGMVVIDGQLISAGTGNYPVLVLRDGKAELMEIDSKLYIEVYRTDGPSAGSGAADSVSGRSGNTGGTAEERSSAAGKKAESMDGDSRKSTLSGAETAVIEINNINFPGGGKQIIAYTPVYGRTNRADRRNITATVVEGVVAKIAEYEKEAQIPGDGMLITFFDVAAYRGKELPVRVGDRVELVHEPDMTGDVQAYECGCWLVRDGVPVVGDYDPWVGVLTNRDPRTAVGIKEDGTVILLTVDGRQPGYSAGFTGRELADYLVRCGAVDAAMLDGGASTAMLLEGKLVNRPSYKGQEREIAGALLVLLEEAAGY